MEHFLELAAKDLFSNFCSEQDGLSKLCLVFPNRRARLFFDEYLSRLADKPIWSPRYMTIEELFHSQSPLVVADKFQLVSILYKVYKEVTHTDEALDSFWSWGELLLSDFDDIDRNMADAGQLFALLKEQKEMSSDHSYLTQEQADAIKAFFSTLKDAGQTELQKKYLEIWARLGDIYNAFKNELLSQGLAYDGMLQRAVAQELDAGNFTADHYAFIGFNGLDAAEKKLFKVLDAAGKALFYWDYDADYTAEGSMAEAGLYMRENLRLFKNRLPEDCFHNLCSEKTITIVETQSDTAQTSYIPQWIEALGDRPDKDCAVVLADSKLVQPLIHSIPPGSTDALNITMGYPLQATLPALLASSLIEMQRTAMKNSGKARLEQVCRVLDNPLVSAMTEKASELRARLLEEKVFFPNISELALGTESQELGRLMRLCHGNLDFLDWLLDVLRMVTPGIKDKETDALFRPLNQEALYRIYTSVNRLRSLSDDGSLEVQTDTLCHLLERLIAGLTVPFHGEPVVGMQVMGLIETRNLDFRNVLLLSASEGSLPGSASESSFIPYNIRAGFGLTTMKEKSAVAAYNFYHLIQRAENITMVYNGNPDAAGSGSGQISRYLYQLMVSGRAIRHLRLEPELQSILPDVGEIAKTKEVTKRLIERYDANDEKSKYLSPSALNTYIDCGVKFWYQYVCRLKPREDKPDDIDYAVFGTLFHKSAELAYNSMISGQQNLVTSEMIDSLLKDTDRLNGFVQQAFSSEVFGGRPVTPADYTGTQTMNYEVLCRYLRQVLELDRKYYAPFRYIASESDGYSKLLEVECADAPGGKVTVKLQGIIDRMDSKDGITRIVDYKTGSSQKAPKELSEIFDSNCNNRSYHYFQIFYYAMLVSEDPRFAGAKLAPVLLYARSSSKPKDSDLYMEIKGNAVLDFAGEQLPEYKQRLEELVKSLFDPSVPFTRTSNQKTCDHCDFRTLCAR